MTHYEMQPDEIRISIWETGTIVVTTDKNDKSFYLGISDTERRMVRNIKREVYADG